MQEPSQQSGYPFNPRPLAGKIAIGLLLAAVLLVLLKLLSLWGRGYLNRAQNDLFDNLWLNEQRRTA